MSRLASQTFFEYRKVGDWYIVVIQRYVWCTYCGNFEAASSYSNMRLLQRIGVYSCSMYRWTWTSLVCPNLWMRSVAWSSIAGFQWRSNRNMWLPPTKFSPSPPDIMDSSITCQIKFNISVSLCPMKQTLLPPPTELTCIYVYTRMPSC